MLFLVEPILREAWPALFEIPHAHNLRNPFPNDWNEFAFQIHEFKCEENQLYILASRFQISLLRVDDLFVVQERILAASSRSENLKKDSPFP